MTFIFIISSKLSNTFLSEHKILKGLFSAFYLKGKINEKNFFEYDDITMQAYICVSEFMKMLLLLNSKKL